MQRQIVLSENEYEELINKQKELEGKERQLNQVLKNIQNTIDHCRVCIENHEEYEIKDSEKVVRMLRVKICELKGLTSILKEKDGVSYWDYIIK